MKKSYWIGGIIGLTSVAMLVIFLNKKSEPKGRSETAELISDVEDSSNEDSDDYAIDPTPSGEKVSWGEDSNFPSEPTEVTEGKAQKIDAFFSHSGVSNAFKVMDEQLEKQFGQFQADSRLTEKQRKSLEDLRKKLNSENLMAGYKEVMKAKFSEADINRLNEVYQDPIIAKLMQGQAHSMTPQGQKELMEFEKKFDVKSIPRERLEALNEYADGQMKMFQSDHPMMQEVKEHGGSVFKDLRKSIVMSAANIFAKESPNQIRQVNRVLADPIVQMENELRTNHLLGVGQEFLEEVLTQGKKSAEDFRE